MTRTAAFVAIVTLAALMFGCKPAAESEGAKGAASTSSEPLLRLNAKAGDHYTMVTTVETTADLPTPEGKVVPSKMEFTSTELHTCTKVEGTRMTWESKNIDMQATGTGAFAAQAEATKSQQKGKVETKVRDERNQVVSDKPDDSLALTYPEKPAKVGDTWSSQTMVMGESVSVTFKLEKFETVSGKEAAMISATVSGGKKLRSDGPLTLWVDLSNGWPIKGAGKFIMDLQPGLSAKMQVQMDVK